MYTARAPGLSIASDVATLDEEHPDIGQIHIALDLIKTGRHEQCRALLEEQHEVMGDQLGNVATQLVGSMCMHGKHLEAAKFVQGMQNFLPPEDLSLLLMLIGRSAIDAGNTEAYMVLIETCFTMFQSDPLSEQLVRDHGPGSFNRLCDTIPTG